MAGPIVLRGGHVVTVVPALGDIAGGDVLIEGEPIDATQHAWEPAIRKRNGNITGDRASAPKKVESSSAYLRDALAERREATTP